MAGQADAQQLQLAMASAYREISHAYLLMVGGTPPMLIGPLVVLLARPFERLAVSSTGGPIDEQALVILRQLAGHMARQVEQGQRQTRLLECIAAPEEPSIREVHQ